MLAVNDHYLASIEINDCETPEKLSLTETVEKKTIIKLTTCGYINNSFIHNIAGSFVFII